MNDIRTFSAKRSHLVPFRNFGPRHVLDGHVPAVPNPQPGVHRAKPALTQHLPNPVGALEGCGARGGAGARGGRGVSPGGQAVVALGGGGGGVGRHLPRPASLHHRGRRHHGADCRGRATHFTEHQPRQRRAGASLVWEPR